MRPEVTGGIGGGWLEGPRAEAVIAGALAVSRRSVWSNSFFQLAMGALEAALAERPMLWVPTLAFDLTILLHGERLEPIEPVEGEALRNALRRYEDDVLARLISERRWTRLMESVAAAPKALRAAAVGMTVAQILSRLKVSGGIGLPQAVVRRLAPKPMSEVLDAGRTALHDAQVARLLAEGFDGVAKAARRARDLLGDAEVFVVENLAALQGLGPRVALAQLAEVAQAVDEQMPSRRRGHLVDHGEASTSLEEEAAFPIGGFSSVSTSGSIENLVTSELVYMERGTMEHLRPDLFDVRFVEGELLYYARDESVALRRTRTVVLVFDASLEAARLLDAGEAYQRIVWALGSVTALVRTLSQWLSLEALRFELVFVQRSGEGALGEEEAVLRLLLREYRERGQVSFASASDSISAVRQAREAHGARGRVVLLSSAVPAGLEGVGAPDAVVLLHSARPNVYWHQGRARSVDAAPSTLEAWVVSANELVDGLLRHAAVGSRGANGPHG